MRLPWILRLCVLLPALLVGHWASPSPGRAAAPNVLIIVTDDQRATDTLSVMPQTRRTFLANGTRYTNAFAATLPFAGNDPDRALRAQHGRAIQQPSDEARSDDHVPPPAPAGPATRRRSRASS